MTLDDENMFCKPSAEGDRRSSEGRVGVDIIHDKEDDEKEGDDIKDD